MKTIFIFNAFLFFVLLISCQNSEHVNTNNDEICSCEFTTSSSTKCDEDFYNYARKKPYCPQGYTINIIGNDHYGNRISSPYMKYYLMKSDWEELKKYSNYYTWFANGPQPKWEYLGGK